MDKYCRLYNPSPEVTEFCKKWMSIATDHCLNLSVKYSKQKFMSSWMSFHPLSKDTELAIQFIPGKMPPSMMTLRDCQRFFFDIVEEIVMDKGTDNLLWALIDSMLGVLVIVNLIIFVTLIVRYRQKIKQMFTALRVFKKSKVHVVKKELRESVCSEDERQQITTLQKLCTQEKPKKRVRFTVFNITQGGRGDSEQVQIQDGV